MRRSPYEEVSSQGFGLRRSPYEEVYLSGQPSLESLVQEDLNFCLRMSPRAPSSSPKRHLDSRF